MKEEWRQIKEFPMYEVSNFGRVRTTSNRSFIKNPPYLSATKSNSGYLRVSLKVKGVSHKKSVHRLVLETFKPTDNPNKVCNHIDGNKLNNYANNLEWVSRSQNLNHAVKLGLIKSGENSTSSKLTNEQARRIKKLRKNGVSLEKIAKAFNVTIYTVSLVACGKTYRYI